MNLQNKNKRIAILTNGDLDNRKGVMNAVHNRIKHLQQIADFDIDVFLITIYYPWYIRLFNKHQRQLRPREISIDGVNYQMIWRTFSLFDYVLRIRNNGSSFIWNHFVKKVVQRLRNYDLIDCHSFQSGDIAYEIKKSFGTPFIVTWHGSEIHTSPFKSQTRFNRTKEIIENASYNLFVSKALLQESERITLVGRKGVIYNAMDARFVQYSEGKNEALRRKLNIPPSMKVVAFCGNLIPIKNALIIPEIFRAVSDNLSDAVFWIIGDGDCRKAMEKQSGGLNIVYWGNQLPEAIPDFMNLIDVLILPSKNEGLPLVTAEALSCGCHVVGSRVGGIAEVIGEENTIPLDHPDFVGEMARRVVYFLTEGKEHPQPLADCFDWNKSALIEKDVIHSII